MNHELFTGNQEKSDSAISSSWDSMEDYRNWAKPDSKYADSRGVETRRIKSLEQMKPVDQLANLANVIEATEADSAYAYLGGAYKFLKKIENSDSFSPLIRIVAGVGKKLDITNEPYNDGENDYSIADSDLFGYSNMVKPEEIPDGVLTPEEEMMDEDEIRLKLAQAKGHSNMSMAAFESDIDDNESMEQSFTNELELALKKRLFAKNQMRLHKEFPALPNDKQLGKLHLTPLQRWSLKRNTARMIGSNIVPQ